jgi:hypothetical protein
MLYLPSPKACCCGSCSSKPWSQPNSKRINDCSHASPYKHPRNHHMQTEFILLRTVHHTETKAYKRASKLIYAARRTRERENHSNRSSNEETTLKTVNERRTSTDDVNGRRPTSTVSDLWGSEPCWGARFGAAWQGSGLHGATRWREKIKIE